MYKTRILLFLYVQEITGYLYRSLCAPEQWISQKPISTVNLIIPIKYKSNKLLLLNFHHYFNIISLVTESTNSRSNFLMNTVEKNYLTKIFINKKKKKRSNNKGAHNNRYKYPGLGRPGSRVTLLRGPLFVTGVKKLDDKEERKHVAYPRFV